MTQEIRGGQMALKYKNIRQKLEIIVMKLIFVITVLNNVLFQN